MRRIDYTAADDEMPAAWMLRVIEKGNKERFVPVTDDAIDALCEHWRDRGWTSTPATPIRRSSRRRSCRRRQPATTSSASRMLRSPGWLAIRRAAQGAS
ncbi:hypothetical protein Bsp3421_000331 (plasmid) [Burkholderia sp. FERM BP-3421]|uniref:hypothetical protein n=1 Tax=Burkholderia sp. FERM BP-3421 TaxID=1494466 RepID=UPI00235E5605|nr:hypothetical protein [Burkholderia sp. FERM BP-3421]WDD90484.1 hypothetical protein Bsp3421_000331 [Burkholderia sp. FERM BP-3421]